MNTPAIVAEVNASRERRTEMLEALRERKGPAYAQAADFLLRVLDSTSQLTNITRTLNAKHDIPGLARIVDHVTKNIDLNCIEQAVLQAHGQRDSDYPEFPDHTDAFFVEFRPILDDYARMQTRVHTILKD